MPRRISPCETHRMPCAYVMGREEVPPPQILIFTILLISKVSFTVQNSVSAVDRSMAYANWRIHNLVFILKISVFT